MLSNGVKVTVQATQDDFLMIDFIVSLLGLLFSISFTAKFWRLNFSTKSYSAKMSLGPVHFLFINLQKMNSHLSDYLSQQNNGATDE